MATFTVTTTSDDASVDGSLRNALSRAGDGDLINFSDSINNSTITITSPLVVARGVTIDGGGDVIVSAAGSNPNINDRPAGVFDVQGGTAPITIENLTIDGGNARGSKGAIGASGANGAAGQPGEQGGPGGTGGNAAGGIYVRSGTVTITDTNFTNSQAIGGTGGFGGSGGTGNAGQDPRAAKGAGGSGGNAAGGVYVEPGASVTAARLTYTNVNATGGAGGSGSPNGQSGTASVFSNDQNVNAAVVCFSTGTRILTARGQVEVEALVTGDQAITASGALRPITWIGHRKFQAETGSLRFEQQPVRVRAGAFGHGLPVRDLSMSPGHPVLVGADADNQGGVLVPVMCLINGTTVARTQADSATYWHVELDAHDILLAEGLPAESYIDGGDRAFFAEGSDHALHNPDFVAPGWNGRCRPVAVDGPIVDAERARLDAVFAGSLNADCAWGADEAYLAV